MEHQERPFLPADNQTACLPAVPRPRSLSQHGNRPLGHPPRRIAPLGEPRNFLRELVVGGSLLLWVAYYPAVPEREDRFPGSAGAASHEDIDLLTLLCEATGSGLELLRPDGSWIPVAAPPGQIIVDAAEMLRNLTNGLLRSITHRVVAPPASGARLSLQFFLHSRPEVDLTPLPGCVARTGGQAHYPRQTAGEYLTRRLREIGLAEAGERDAATTLPE